MNQFKAEFALIESELKSLIANWPVKRLDRSIAGVVLVMPDFYWGNGSPEQFRRQMDIKRRYESWIGTLQSAFGDPPEGIGRRISRADSNLRKWLELKSNWTLSPDPATNISNLDRQLRDFDEIIEILGPKDPDELIVVPDTNAIAERPEPLGYKSLAGTDKFTFLLVPQVISEIDRQKNDHSNSSYREKAKDVVRRIKGWRKQGSLIRGVKHHGSITVKALGVEPNFNIAPNWLDRHDPDDRIIATILEVQNANPNARVVLVSRDINLLNKAEISRIETADLT